VGKRDSRRTPREREIVRRSILLVSALALVLGFTPACSDKTSGLAVPGAPTGGQTTTTTSGRATTTSPKTSTSGGNSPITGKDPCSLLTASAKSQLGLSGNGEKSTVAGAPGCKWQRRDASGDLHLFAVDIVGNKGIRDIPAATKQIPAIDGHDAVQVAGIAGPGSCSVVIGVTDKSRVDTTVVAGTDEQKSCDLALQTAKLVAPELR
jgi:Protein of unknown function (DUF3558)